MNMKIKRIMKNIISGLLILVLTGGWYSDACMVKADCVKANDEFSLIDINEFVISPEPIMEIDNGRYKAYFSYDSNKTRISKEYNEKQTIYKYDGNLLVVESGEHASYNESRFTYSNDAWTYRGTAVTNLALAGTASLDNVTIEHPDDNPRENAKIVIEPYRNHGYNIFFNY